MSAEVNVAVPALRENSIKTSDELMVSDQMLMDVPVGGEMETLEMFHLVEVPELTEVDMISPVQSTVVTCHKFKTQSNWKRRKKVYPPFFLHWFPF